MVRSKIIELERYYNYSNFILSSMGKSYNDDIVTHAHHIIPKHIWEDKELSVNNKENIISLSVEDHITAHLLLANCYEKGTYEYVNNIRSVVILMGKSIKFKEELLLLSIINKGDKNPFYGKNHTEETKKKLSEITKSNLTGVSYENRYGETANIEKEKRRNGVKLNWQNMTEEERNLRIKRMSESKKNKNTGHSNNFSKKVTIENITYNSILEATKALNISRYKLNKMLKNK